MMRWAKTAYIKSSFRASLTAATSKGRMET